MKFYSVALALFLAASCIAGSSAQTLPSGLQPVHKSVAATCVSSWKAQPATYDNLDASAKYTCYAPPPTCASVLAVWWQEPPNVANGMFRYSCAATAAGPTPSFTATCAAGFSVQNFRQGQAPNQNVKYACVSAPITCPSVFSLNSSDPDFFGWKSGTFMYKCTKIS